MQFSEFPDFAAADDLFTRVLSPNPTKYGLVIQWDQIDTFLISVVHHQDILVIKSVSSKYHFEFSWKSRRRHRDVTLDRSIHKESGRYSLIGIKSTKRYRKHDTKFFDGMSWKVHFLLLLAVISPLGDTTWNDVSWTVITEEIIRSHPSKTWGKDDHGAIKYSLEDSGRSRMDRVETGSSHKLTGHCIFGGESVGLSDSSQRDPREGHKIEQLTRYKQV